MSDIPRKVSAEVILPGVLKIEWDDRYVGVADLRPVIARGGLFEPLKSPDQFGAFTIGEHGHALVWLNAQGREIDLGTGSLCKRAETQAELHRLAG